MRKMIRHVAGEAGIESTSLEPISAHGLGAGFITEACKQGIDDESIMGHSRRKDVSTMRRHVRRAKIVSGSVAGKLGL
ncbi:site-specific integrase [Sabulicella glaciei]|uniref:Uncharacterized protein n=1 Tax=Sabulicella glaciei TaxID=2984948 RepID=A0ABT3NTS6_9PROT|nr:hypothetical protein [Roseococcus sp. MDT2-1-1]MCW8085550.1 hypothetical protein [Roseococcus sp. MDT2-1-1]